MQLSLFDGTEKIKIKKPIRLIELFAGIGSQAKALKNLSKPFEYYRICEFDKYAVQSYNAVHGTNFKLSDITKIKAADLGITETDKYEYIMTYSFPCQDLSIAGKQSGMAKGSGTRSGLLWEVERLLKECKELPQVLLMENVPQVLNCDFGGWLDFLDSLGYKNYYKILNAKNFGVPQNRNRCFMVSVLGDYFYAFPNGRPLTLRLKDILEKSVDEKFYVTREQADKLRSSTFVHHKNTIMSMGGWNSEDTNSTRSETADLCRTIRVGGRNSYDEKHRWDLVRVDMNSDYRVRKLTPKECMKLMGFSSEDYEKQKSAGVSNSQIYKQAGNSIVVPVLEAIFRNLF